jgi:predicted nucleic acid-binding Zn finger protein
MPAMGLPALLRVSQGRSHRAEYVRSVVHGCCPLEIGLVAVGHGTVPCHHVLGVGHGVVGHH